MTDDRRDAPLDHDELSAYLDGELDAAGRESVVADLDASAARRDELSGVAAARAAVRGLPALDPGDATWAAILAAVDDADDEDAHARSPRRAWRWLAAAAAVVAVVLGAAAAVPGTHRVRPNVTAVAVQHGAQSAHVGDPIGALVPLGAVTPPTGNPS